MNLVRNNTKLFKKVGNFMTVLVMIPVLIPILLGLMGYFLSKKIYIGVIVLLVSAIPTYIFYTHLKSIWIVVIGIFLMWYVIYLFMNFKKS